MITNPYYLLSILSSSLLAFFTAAFIIEVVIRIFRVTQHRIRAFLRLLPILSIILDIVFKKSSFIHWINPLSCTSCVQKFFLNSFFPQLNAHLSENQISLINYLGSLHQNSIFGFVFILFLAISGLLVLRKAAQAWLLTRALRSIIRNAIPSERAIESPQLKAALLNGDIHIYVSHEIGIPLAAYSNTILVPAKTMEILSQEEFEAVIAHELEHLQNLDPLMRILYRFVSTLFWWIPIQGWIKKLELDQEMACDQSIRKYGLDSELIASALVKVARQVKTEQSLCYFIDQTNPTKIRLNNALGLNNATTEHLFGLNFLGIAAGMVFLLVCVQWL